MKEFLAAAKAADTDEDPYLEFAIGADEFRVSLPSTARVALFVASMTDEASTADALSAIFSLLKDTLQDDGYRRLRKLIANGTIELSLLTGGDEQNEEGIVDWIIKSASQGRPTPPSAGSSASPGAGGRRSTGRSPGQGSILSDSPSPVS